MAKRSSTASNLALSRMDLPNHEEINDLKPLTAKERAAVTEVSDEEGEETEAAGTDEGEDDDFCCTEDEDIIQVKATPREPWRTSTSTTNPNASSTVRTRTLVPLSSENFKTYIPQYPNPHDVDDTDPSVLFPDGYEWRDDKTHLTALKAPNGSEFTDKDVGLRFIGPTAQELRYSQENRVAREREDRQTRGEWGGGRNGDGRGVLEFFSYAGEGLGNAVDGCKKGVKVFETDERGRSKKVDIAKKGEGKKKRKYTWHDKGWEAGGAKRMRNLNKLAGVETLSEHADESRTGRRLL